MTLADELLRTANNRLDAIERHVGGLRGALGDSRPGYSRALQLLAQFPISASEVLQQEWAVNTTAASRISLTRNYLQHINYVSGLVEDWFSSASTTSLPSSLTKAVERECETLFGKRDAILAVGSADNFVTFVADLREQVFDDLGPRQPKLPESIQDLKFALMRVPRLEGSQALWRPIVIGHELAHIAIAAKNNPFDLASIFDWTTASGLSIPPLARTKNPAELAVYEAAEMWAEELLCDAYAVRRFGPAALAALGNFLESVGSLYLVSTHPPGWLRIKLMVKWLDEIAAAELKELVEPWRSVATLTPPPMADWASHLCQLFETHEARFPSSLSTWSVKYESDSRLATVNRAADNLREGIADGQIRGSDLPEDADLINAAWVGWAGQYDPPVEPLTAKALESREFLRRWSESGGGNVQPDPITITSEVSGSLSKEAIAWRLEAEGDARLVVTPLLPSWGEGTAIDLRLGNAFIVFHRTRTAAFDPLATQRDARSMQVRVDREWGETFVLHPGELVLSATLEYLVLPADLGAQVVTRSSYGRLGLLTATAVLVHPHFHGCLTLELVNLGVLPIELTPGERIAQLTLHPVNPPVPRPSREKYRYPTGPEFSKVGTDWDSEFLRKMRGGR